MAPRLVPAPLGWQFGVAYPLPEKAVDHAFTGWGGRALVEWPARRFSLAIVGNTDCYRLRALPEDDLFWFQVMNDQSEHGYVRGGDGVNTLTTLAVGETLSRRVSFTVERLASLTKTARYATQ
jgi:aldose 1-epimerase